MAVSVPPYCTSPYGVAPFPHVMSLLTGAAEVVVANVDVVAVVVVEVLVVVAVVVLVVDDVVVVVAGVDLHEDSTRAITSRRLNPSHRILFPI